MRVGQEKSAALPGWGLTSSNPLPPAIRSTLRLSERAVIHVEHDSTELVSMFVSFFGYRLSGFSGTNQDQQRRVAVRRLVDELEAILPIMRALAGQEVGR